MKRELPVRMKLGLYFNGFTMLGGIGLCIGLIISYSQISIRELQRESRLEEVTTTAKGVILDVYEADWNEYGDIKLYGYDYFFYHEDLGELTNTSFHKRKLYNKKDSVTIVYDPDFPYASRVSNLNYASSGYSVLFVLFLPAMALVFLMIGLRKAWFRVCLLRYGYFAEGRFLESVKTNVSVNDEPIYKLYYQYEGQSGEVYSGYEKTSYPRDYETIETVIYDPKRPTKMHLLYSYSNYVVDYMKQKYDVE